MSSVLVRLRPIVRATPTPDGLHLRGWSSNCTITGGTGLWQVWQRLAPQLTAGVPAASLGAPAGTAPAVRAAVELILEQLWEHDMLVSMPDWGADRPAPDVAAWLESVAPDPVGAWRRLRAVTVTISGRGLVAEAAVRAAGAVGLAARRAGGPGVGHVQADGVADNGEVAVRRAGEPGVLHIQADGGVECGGLAVSAADSGGLAVSAADSGGLAVSAAGRVVLAGCGAEVGYVLPVVEGLSSVNTEVTARTIARVRPVGEPTQVLAALIGSAAVHRLICALTDLPDQAAQFTGLPDLTATHAGRPAPPAEPAPAPYPMALIAQATPLRATYHPILTGPPPPDPWRGLEALTDPELGPVATPVFGTLPQLPANLATSGDTLGIGTSADAARLDAALNSLKSDSIIGLGNRHARGAALRLAARNHTGEPTPAEEWNTDPTARRWWKALTARFGIPATVHVERLAPNAYKAEIRTSQQLAWAVEATAQDAVAFAALAATGHAQAGRPGTAHLNGAAQIPGEQPANRAWRWPTDVQNNEDKLQQALAALPRVRIEPAALDPELEAAGLVAYTVDGQR